MPMQIPVVDIAPFTAAGAGDGEKARVAAEIHAACREVGFFYVTNHGVDRTLCRRLEDSCRQFFALDHADKMAIEMARGGKAWRGYFPVGDELTSGQPDQKEGLYFGAELPDDDPDVQAGTPLHGANLFPREPVALRPTVLAFIDAMTRLGHVLMEALAVGHGGGMREFVARCTADPLVLLRVFHYPALALDDHRWSVAEHTDYGLLTILMQDDAGGLQVKSRDGWVEAPPLEGTFVCNLGDMLDRLTGGMYRSTPHRVHNTSGRGRLSFPFFFDPNYHAEVRAIESAEVVVDDRDERWDRQSVHADQGTYGDYLMQKIGKVFPELGRDVLDPG